MVRPVLALTFIAAILSTASADAQVGVQQRVVFWGVLAHDAKLTRNEWVPLAIYPDAASAEAASAVLRRHGLTGRVLQGYATSAELAQHAVTAERGRTHLQRLLQKEQLAAIQEDFQRSNNIVEPRRDSTSNVVERAGFDQRRRQTIENAGFNEARRNTINNAGFDPFRRQTINTSRFPIAPQNQVQQPRGNFGTQPGQRPANFRGNFGTQPGQQTNNARGNFGTQPAQRANTNNSKGAFGTR